MTVLLTYDGTPPRYRFTCPSCGQVVEKVTTRRAVSMLHGVGAAMMFAPAGQQLPVRATVERAEVSTRTRILDIPITAGEIRAFRRALDRVDDIAAAASSPQLP